jgi:C4-dicarboxylate-specific signal transduction histidine kinase
MNSRRTPSERHPDPISHLAHQLGERVKELNCLFGISDIVERAAGSLERIFRETVELLPQSWNHADVACARIVMGDEEHRSRAYAEPVSTLQSEIMVHGEKAGIVEVSYWEPRPFEEEGPFMKEERRLLNAVAERMGHIIERLTVEERLREKEEEFREKMTHLTRVTTMGEMASSIAHEVNQPLTAIATYAQACRRLIDGDLVETPEVLDVLERIGEEAIRAGDIIRRLRGLVKKRDDEMQECDITQLLNEISPLAFVDARLNDIELSFVLPQSTPRILADGVQIQQVILNLIRNGIDSMLNNDPGQRILEVRAEHVTGEGVSVSVRDQGCGIPEDRGDHLFQPFFTTKEAGLGLGLSISRSIISKHGGQLWFSRNSGGGTTFHFTLPEAR